MLRLPQNEQLKVLKMLCLPRNHYVKALPEKIPKRARKRILKQIASQRQPERRHAMNET